MKKELSYLVIGLFLMMGLVGAAYQTVYNPYTAKNDYVNWINSMIQENLNFNGYNVTNISRLILVDPTEVANIPNGSVALKIRTKLSTEAGILTSYTPMDWAVPTSENLQIGEMNSTTGAWIENFRINAGGNVGVKVSSPDVRMHVNGSIKAYNMTFNITTGATCPIQYVNDSGCFITESCSGSRIALC